MNPPQGILFDLGDTVVIERVGFDVRAGRERIVELCRNPQGVSMDVYHAASDELRDIVESMREDSAIEFSTHLFTRLIFDRLGLEPVCNEEQLELEFWQASTHMSPAAGIEDALDDLARRGIPFGIVSNTAFTGHVLRWELERHGLLEPFAFVMASADYGLRKPHPYLFTTAAARLGSDPAKTWYVGDSLKYDVAGARNAGMGAVWYNPGGASPDGVTPDAELRHWGELAAVVDGASATA